MLGTFVFLFCGVVLTYPVGLRTRVLIPGMFSSISILSMRAAKAQTSMCICADSPDHSLLDCVISSKIARVD